MKIINQPTAGMQVAFKAWSRDANAANGDVAYTGIGFKPKGIVCFAGAYYANLCSGALGTGYDDQGGIGQDLFIPGWTNVGDNIASGFDAAGNGWMAKLKQFDSDGFTITYTKYGDLGETIYYYALVWG